MLSVFNLKTLETNLKLIHYLFYLVVAPVSIFCFINWGWSFYSTITDRPGLWGSMYEYYKLSKEIYSLYFFLVAATSLVFLIIPIALLINRKAMQLTRFYIGFLVFALLVIVSEIILSYRFEGKG